MVGEAPRRNMEPLSKWASTALAREVSERRTMSGLSQPTMAILLTCRDPITSGSI